MRCRLKFCLLLQVALQAEAIVKELTQQDDGARALNHNITVNMHALL